ncbi:hypothetical protein P167DRAFT_407847 [Morchella conica CCBAS932]|uniref:Uncharacterized protein n=1 Tax=Morchella conica CCBAS932 TaxID=1392247 RepID=A0A3N4KYF7_9PEZI|nr:hypothetical protein P167DRAFT_407847 [Morchella conica CCBAS932]
MFCFCVSRVAMRPRADGGGRSWCKHCWNCRARAWDLQDSFLLSFSYLVSLVNRLESMGAPGCGALANETKHESRMPTSFMIDHREEYLEFGNKSDYRARIPYVP